MSVARVSIVTGGAGGIGQAIVRRLAADGDRVIVADRSEAAHEVAASVGAEAWVGDLADEGAIGALIEQVRDRHGGIDSLVCAAGVSLKRDGVALRLETTTLAEWQTMLAVNLTGIFLIARAAIPTMRGRADGRIVVIGSQGGRTRPQATSGAYAASKAGLIGLTRALANELAPDRITANYVAPGAVETPMMQAFDATTQARVLDGIPLGRRARPDEIAHAVAFLLSRDAGYMTGAILDVNGGMFMP